MNGPEHLPRLDKLGVTGSSPVPPTPKTLSPSRGFRVSGRRRCEAAPAERAGRPVRADRCSYGAHGGGHPRGPNSSDACAADQEALARVDHRAGHPRALRETAETPNSDAPAVAEHRRRWHITLARIADADTTVANPESSVDAHADRARRVIALAVDAKSALSVIPHLAADVSTGERNRHSHASYWQPRLVHASNRRRRACAVPVPDASLLPSAGAATWVACTEDRTPFP